MDALDGRIAVVIGGARGIGKAYCEALLKNGVKVAFGDILTDVARETQRELGEKYGHENIVFQECSVTSEEQIEALSALTKKSFGQISIFVNNVGMINEFDWKTCVDVNVGGLVRTTMAALKYMSKENGGIGGDLIHTSSRSGLIGEYMSPLYSAAKSAVIGYVRGWGRPEHYNATKVRVNCICPALIDTAFPGTITPDTTYYSDNFQSYMDKMKKIPPSFVAEGLIKILEDPSANGRALRVTNTCGLDYQEFAEFPKD